MGTMRRSTLGTWTALFVVVLMLASGLAAVGLSHASPSSASGGQNSVAPAHLPAIRAPVAAQPAPAAPPTHGDLVVTAGESYYINSTEGAPIYFQAGNITVDSGGTLDINKVNLSFVQFIGSSGTPKVRLSHIDHFTDLAGGTVKVDNSTVTTDMFEINAYPKLNLTIQGTMDLQDSTFAFPGWVNVEGAGASLTLNGSVITRNPQILSFHQPTVLQAAEDFAPTLRASAGGVVNLFNSNLSATFADNLTLNATPRPVPLGVTNNRYANGTPRLNVSFVPGSNENLTITDTSNSSAALTQDWLYPSGVTGGEVVVYYNNSFLHTTTATVTVWFNGHSYDLGTVTLQNGTDGGRAAALFSPALTAAVNAVGLMGYLNLTGDFGVGPAKISVALSAIANAGGDIVVTSGVFFQLNPPVSYDVLATGVGTHVNTVDTSMDLTFAAVGATPISMHNPLPWLANKLSLTNGANASLGNLVAPNPIPGVFETSVVITDATSHAYLYRWAQVNLSGLGGQLPVYGGHVTAFYAYNAVQQNNVTANRANDLATWDLPIWKYVQYWDHQHGLPSYATSGFGGSASLLLVSNEITSSTLPDGIFMGGYHFLVTIPVATGNKHAFNGSVSPYPVGVALGTPWYGIPDFAHPQNFPSYFAGLDTVAGSLTVYSNGVVVPGSIIHIGETLEVKVTVNDTGTAPIFQLSPGLYWFKNGTELLTNSTIPVALDLPGQHHTFGLNWTVTEAVTGLKGSNFTNIFDLGIVWNHGELSFGGGTFPVPVKVDIYPSFMHLFRVVTPLLPVGGGTPINVNSLYQTTGKVTYNGSAAATLEVLATPTTGGAAILIGENTHAAGNFTVTWFNFDSIPSLSARLSAGTTYVISVRASYNGASYTFGMNGTYLDPTTPAPKQNILTEKFLGLPLWLWLAIAGAIVVGLLAFFMVARRQAAGKVVECGECGALIPEAPRRVRSAVPSSNPTSSAAVAAPPRSPRTRSSAPSARLSSWESPVRAAATRSAMGTPTSPSGTGPRPRRSSARTTTRGRSGTGGSASQPTPRSAPWKLQQQQGAPRPA